MNTTPAAGEFRYGERGVIRAGDLFRARGGPTFRGGRVGEPGLYRLLAVERCRSRVYLVAVRVDRQGVQVGGVYSLFVAGKPYRLPALPEWVVRPYRVSRCR